MSNVQQQKKTTLPASKNGAHIRQSEVFSLITGSKLCHCRSCFLCMLYHFGKATLTYMCNHWLLYYHWCLLYHTHYSQWLSVHIRDMMSLPVNHPNIQAEFHAGQFVAHKTKEQLFSMVISRIMVPSKYQMGQMD